MFSELNALAAGETMNPEESMHTKQSAAAHTPRDREDARGTYAKVAVAAAAIGGWAIGMYAGVDLLVPLLATAAVWLLGKKLFPERQAVLPSFSVQAGHLAWFIVGMLITRQFLGLGLIDVAWYAVGLAWLWTRSSKASLCFLGVYQLLSLPYNLFVFSQSELGSATNKALLVHIVWRCLALFYMARLYYQTNKQAAHADEENRA